MLPSELENYLIKCRNQKASFDAVAENLAAAGWSADMILSAKSWYLGNEQKPLLNPVDQTRIQNNKIFTTPAETKNYPGTRLGPLVWIILFLALSTVSFIVLTTF